nr:O-antigen ligase family protein [Lachnospiraceae bacterium]
KYAFFLAGGLIFVLDALSQGKKFYIKIGSFQICFFAFVAFCFLSSIWALSRANAIEWSKSLISNWVCMSLIYTYYSRKKDISMLLTVIMWSGSLIAIYTIWFYGLDVLFASSLTQYVRLGNDYSNINTIGMFCAFAILIQIERLMYDRKLRISIIFVIPSLIVVAATQSRKAVLLIVIGTIIIAVMKSTNRKKAIKTLGKYILIFMTVVVVLLVLSKITIFSGVSERLNQLLSVITGSGQIDSGTINRQNYIDLGIKTWLQNPIGGVGVNCPRIINQRVYGEYVYLHNNYVELLCGVGTIGFLFYYFMYYYVVKYLVRYKKANRRYYIIGITWVILLLIMDYGMVSYYSKLQCFYFMTLFLNIECMKKMYYGQLVGGI